MRVAALSLSLFLLACPNVEPPSPGDAGSDAGPIAPDAGPPAPVDDAGPPAPVDAGAPPPVDAGEPDHAPGTDAGLAYFADIGDELEDEALVAALHDKLAGDHIELPFADLFSAYETLDADRAGCDGIFDFYSDNCWSPTDACGQYAAEGDCFNREHSWPKSWWGGSENADQHQDLIAVVPADGFVNGVRANLPFGEVDEPTYVSTNGSKRGLCVTPGAPAGELCFEPAPRLRGDFARIYFYVAIRYEDEFNCCDELAITDDDVNPWQETMLRRWHRADPVDVDERARNERIQPMQGNRNPFVDRPDFVDRIADF